MSKQKEERQDSGNPYDRIWRENMDVALPGIIEKIFKIRVVESRNLPDKVVITKQREVDALREILDASGDRFILHIEIQTRDDPEMIYRMAEYNIMIERQYKLPVRQYVIYIGRGKSKMVSVLKSGSLYFEYNLISLSQIPYKLFLLSRHPEERLLAILGNFEGEDAETVLTSIIKQVRQATKEDLSENQYLQQLRILIQLRNLAKQFDKAMEKVSKFFKEERDPFFLRGVRKGMEQGREAGLEEGREEGIEMKNRQIVQNLITELGLSDEQTAKVAEVSIEFVRKIRSSKSGE